MNKMSCLVFPSKYYQYIKHSQSITQIWTIGANHVCTTRILQKTGLTARCPKTIWHFV